VNAFLAGDKQNKNQQTEKLRNWEEEADISQAKSIFFRDAPFSWLKNPLLLPNFLAFMLFLSFSSFPCALGKRLCILDEYIFASLVLILHKLVIYC